MENICRIRFDRKGQKFPSSALGMNKLIVKLLLIFTDSSGEGTKGPM